MKSVRERAMDFLARREHSEYELTQKLLSRELPVEEVRENIQTLIQDGLLSDERFTEAFIYSRRLRGTGPLKIRAELRQKGVSDAMINRLLQEQDSEWLNLAQDVRVKKFGAPLPGNVKEKARQTRFLQQRGFTHEQVRNVLRDDEF